MLVDIKPFDLDTNRCVFCKRQYGSEWDHYCLPEDLKKYYHMYEDWEQSFEK